jgi:hypothetical protein
VARLEAYEVTYNDHLSNDTPATGDPGHFRGGRQDPGGNRTPWLRLAFALCTFLAAIGTWFASPVLLWALIPVAALAAAFPVHPFDLLYNHGLRHLRGTGPLPKRGAPSRFACGLGAVWLLATGWAFSSGYMSAGYLFGGALTAVGLLASTTDICIPSLIYRSIFGFPPRAGGGKA